MSIRLPSIDLTGLAVGASGQVQIPQPKVQIGEMGHLRIYNESGAGINVAFSNGHSEVVPAGAWPMFEIEPETQTYTWTITYVLPNAPVALLEAVYYFPYEGVPPTPALGNSPIGITGGVTTSSVQTLSNEGNASGTLVVDVGDTGNVNLFTLYTDGHTLWKVDQSGVLHQVFKVQTAGNPLQLGQAGDTTEVLGALTVDQAATLAAAGVLTHVLGTLTVDQLVTIASGGLSVAAGGIGVTLGGVGISGGGLAVTGGNVSVTNDLFLVNKKLSTAASGDLADWSGAGCVVKGNPTNLGNFQWWGNNVNEDWGISFQGPDFTGTGGGTFNHLCKQFNAAAAPTNWYQNAATGGGSNSLGFGSITTTQVAVGSLNAVAWKARGRDG